MLDLAFNEIEGMVRLATRGMGAPWGMADDAARLAVWLARRGLPFAAPVLAQEGHRFVLSLERVAGTSITLDKPVSGLALACLLQDFPAIEHGRFAQVAGPALLVPALAMRQGGGIIASPELPELLSASHSAVTIAPGKARDFPVQARGSASHPEWDALAKRAHHTYVPMSEASRLAGAGAGTSDND